MDNKFELERKRLDKLRVASILLVIIAVITIMFGIVYFFTPCHVQWNILGIPYHEDFIDMTHGEISKINPKLADSLLLSLKLIGVTFIGLGIWGIAVSLNSYRKGEKWAWYATLITNLVVLIPLLVISHSVEAPVFPIVLIMFIVFLIAILLPAKEVLG